jgi:secretory carrier-associated membrane protein
MGMYLHHQSRTLLTLFIADYTHNPFASTHSLDTNPFDDPNPSYTQSNAAEAQRLEELRRREEALNQREQDLNNRAEHIRKHGRNNWPFCVSYIYFSLAFSHSTI